MRGMEAAQQAMHHMPDQRQEIQVKIINFDPPLPDEACPDHDEYSERNCPICEQIAEDYREMVAEERRLERRYGAY
jgi:hypothetical protein